MGEVILSSTILVGSGVVIYRRCGGIFSLPFVCYAHLICLYLGAVGFFLHQGSSTYWHVAFAGSAFALGIFLGGNNPLKKSTKEKKANVIPDIGLHPKIFQYTLAVITPISLFIALVAVQQAGIPLLAKAIPEQMVKQTSGPIRRLLLALGSDNLLFLSLGWYVLYRVRHRSLHVIICVFCLLAGLFFTSLLGSKAAALTVMLMFLFGFFYFIRRTPKPGVLALIGAVTLVTTYIVTSYHYLPIPGMNPLVFFYERLTRIAVSPLDFLLRSWIPHFGHAGLWPFHAEVERIIANVTGSSKPVLFNEYIWDLRNGFSPYAVTGLAESLFLYGTGTACFGVAGGLLLVSSFGFMSQKLNRYLLSAKKINFLVFAAAMYLIYELFMEAWVAGTPLIALQSFVILVIPKYVLFGAIYLLFALPFRISLNWSRPSGKRRNFSQPTENAGEYRRELPSSIHATNAPKQPRSNRMRFVSHARYRPKH